MNWGIIPRHFHMKRRSSPIHISLLVTSICISASIIQFICFLDSKIYFVFHALKLRCVQFRHWRTIGRGRKNDEGNPNLPRGIHPRPFYSLTYQRAPRMCRTTNLNNSHYGWILFLTSSNQPKAALVIRWNR